MSSEDLNRIGVQNGGTFRPGGFKGFLEGIQSERKRILEIIDNLYETEAFPEKHPEKLSTIRTIKFLIQKG